MSRPATERLKINPQQGALPVLQYLTPQQLQIDARYQRTLESDASKTLVRQIAQNWSWDLCQVLVVARRDDGALFVIDGQHRLEAAKLRGDIGQLPAVVVNYASAQDEAAAFVHLNQARKPLTRIDLFKAAVASEDGEALAIVEAIQAAGLTIASHSNWTAWKPGMVSNIGGIEAAWRRYGGAVARRALMAMAQGFEGQILRYCGTVWPGIAAVVDLESAPGAPVDDERLAWIVELIRSQSQDEWRAQVLRAKAANANLKFAAASAEAFLTAWAEMGGEDEVARVARWREMMAGAQSKPAGPKVLSEANIDLVFEHLAEAAENGLPCPTNIEIEALIGANSSSMGARAIEVLEKRGLIRVSRSQKARLVTIVATGKTTAPPVSMKQVTPLVHRAGTVDDRAAWDAALATDVVADPDDDPDDDDGAEDAPMDLAVLPALSRPVQRVSAPAPKPAPKPDPKPEPDRGQRPVINWGRVSETARRGAAKAPITPNFDMEGKTWCRQCDCRRSRNQVAGCVSKFCPFKVQA